jgi:RNA polymerase sigma-70 factor, ECF subfamily
MWQGLTSERTVNQRETACYMAGLDALEDGDLIRRSIDGDERAFRQIVDRYESTVAGVVMGMLGRGAEADDVGQEVFVRFFRAMDRFRGDSSLGTYLTRIAINQSLKALKKRQRWYDRFLSRDVSEIHEDPPSDRDVVEDVELFERATQLRAALEELSPDHRAVIVLRVMEGYSTRETSDMLGVPEGTVMSRLKRGLEKMRLLIETRAIDL